MDAMNFRARVSENRLSQPAHMSLGKGVRLSDSPGSQHGVPQGAVGCFDPRLIATENVAHELAPRRAACPTPRGNEMLALCPHPGILKAGANDIAEGLEQCPVQVGSIVLDVKPDDGRTPDHEICPRVGHEVGHHERRVGVHRQSRCRIVQRFEIGRFLRKPREPGGCPR